MTWENLQKAGSGWTYNEFNLTYNQENDPLTGSTVYYNSIGELNTFSASSKGSSSWTAQTKGSSSWTNISK